MLRMRGGLWVNASVLEIAAMLGGYPYQQPFGADKVPAASECGGEPKAVTWARRFRFGAHCQRWVSRKIPSSWG